MKIRTGTRDDVLCISVLATQVFLDTYATDGIRPDLAREALTEYSIDEFTSRLRDTDTTFVLAEGDDGLLGFAEVTRKRICPSTDVTDTVELVRLYVQRRAQRAGLGRALLHQAEQLACAAGATALWLTAWSGNAQALAFYQALGYRCVGTTEHVIESQAYENKILVSSELRSAVT